MHKLNAVLLIAAIAVITTGCSDTDAGATITGPTPLALSSTSAVVTAQPLTVTNQSVGVGGCPAVQPFRSGFNLVVQAGAIGVSVTDVHLRFVESNVITAQQVTLPAPVPMTQFGSALVEARSTRSFAFDFRFGCGTGRHGTVIIVVVTRDERGSVRTQEVPMTVN